MRGKDYFSRHCNAVRLEQNLRNGGKAHYCQRIVQDLRLPDVSIIWMSSGGACHYVGWATATALRLGHSPNYYVS